MNLQTAGYYSSLVSRCLNAPTVLLTQWLGARAKFLVHDIMMWRFFLMNANHLPETVFFLHVARLKVCCLTVIEDTDRKGEFTRILCFLFMEKEKLQNFIKENWLQWLWPSFLHDRAFVLLWNTTKDSKVCKEFSGSLFT